MDGYVGLSGESAVFTHMLEKYALGFSEKLTLESNEDFIYLSDPVTYELYLINVVDPGKIKRTWGDYQGKKCYQVLQGRTEPCPFCTNDILSREQYYIWKHHNDIINGDYILKDKLVEWEGKTVRMEVVMDVSGPERTDEVLQRSLNGQNVLASCMRSLLDQKEASGAARELLSKMCRFFGAEEGFMHFFIQSGKVIRWDQKQETIRTMDKKLPSFRLRSYWEELLAGGKQVIVKDAAQLAGRDDTSYQVLKESGTQSFCLTPICAGKRLLGFMGLKNITRYWTELSLLNMLADYTSAFLMKEELKLENQRIMYYDGTTGYLNFEGFKKNALKLLQENTDKKYVLWYSDLKKFKYINDVFGYETGDKFLKYWAQSIARTMEPWETFGRISGDKFVVLRCYRDENELERRFRNMADTLELFAQDYKGVRVEFACGAYLMENPEDRLSLNEMLDRANMAEKSVKPLSGSHMAVYSESMRSSAVNEMQMESAVREAMDREEFVMYLQPQVSLRPARCLRAEALVRWKGTDGCLAYPSVFIPILEREGIIAKLDRYMFEHACRYVQDWREKDGRPLCVTVNVSRMTMLQPDFVESFSRIKEAYHIPRGGIELEFTESVIVENHEVFREIVDGLKEAGFPCAMDDFGAEQSSLNIVKDIPMDVLKFDRRFFEKGKEDERGLAVISCMMKLAEALNMETVAEGVEDSELVELLKKMGCDYIQGYVFSKPMPAEDYQAFLAEFSAASVT